MNKFLIGIMLVLSSVSSSFSEPNPGNDPRVAIDSVFSVNLFDKTMKEGVSCYRIPSIVTATNGDLIAAIDERVPSCGDLKFSRDINIVVRRSQDDGKTWSPIETAVDYPLGQSASDPSMIVDEKTGEIFLFYNYMDHDKEKDVFYLHVVTSNDYGKTWSKARDLTPFITTSDMKNDFKFITSGRGVYTMDGILLHNMVNLQKGLTVFGSEDHGKTWKVYSSGIRNSDESKIIDLSDGDWMINSRTSKGRRCIHLSEDHGKTWTSFEDHVLKDPSCNAGLIRYSSVAEGDDKDRIIFSNANDSKNRRNLTIRLSYDNGKTWAYSKVLYPGNAAYSSLTRLQNGDIAVFFEKDDYSLNEVSIFSLAWLTDGADTYKKVNKP